MLLRHVFQDDLFTAVEFSQTFLFRLEVGTDHSKTEPRENASSIHVRKVFRKSYLLLIKISLSNKTIVQIQERMQQRTYRKWAC